MKTREELQERITQLEQMLGLNDAPPPLGLARNPARMLGILMRRDFVSLSFAYDVLFGDRPEPPTGQVVRGTVKRLRKSLLSIGVEIKNRHGHGYYIEAEDKQKILAQWPQIKKAA